MAEKKNWSSNPLEEAKRKISESEGFPFEKIDEFVCFLGDEPYITSAGLQYKMLQTYKAGCFAVQAQMPSQDEYALLRRMMGLKDDDPMVVMRGEVWIAGQEKPFVDYGTATPKNLKGFVRFSDYPVEMATRRATNRAMRLATATGMCSMDEVKEPPLPDSDGEGAEQELATQDQIDRIVSLSRNPLTKDSERQDAEEAVRNRITKKQAEKLISQMGANIKKRLSAQKPAPEDGAQSKPPTSEGEKPEAVTHETLETLRNLAKHPLITADEITRLTGKVKAGLSEKDAKVLAEKTANALKKRTESQAKSEAPPIDRADFLHRCKQYEAWIGVDNFQKVLFQHEVENADSVRDEQSDMANVLADLQAANEHCIKWEDHLSGLAKRHNKVGKLSEFLSTQFKKTRIEHLTDDQAKKAEQWVTKGGVN